MKTVRHAISYLAFSAFLFIVHTGASAAPFEYKIEKLKDLHLETTLVSDGAPAAVIVVPADARYDAALERIQRALQARSGVRLPVRRGVADPAKQLADTHVIALGNMSSNPFIYKLYCQWYCLLDLKYPGKGGYVVRSVHNPYATGRNVILVGGSDDQGVARAADRFCALLPKGKTVKLGWLLDVGLGEGMDLPKVVRADGHLMLENNPRGEIRSWRSAGRSNPDGKKKAGARHFGWNPISIAGMLYYMTGDQSYMDYFKSIAMPDPKNLPPAVRKLHGLEAEPERPMVQMSEYYCFLLDCVWDLIEESPLLSNADRLHITRELLAHQLWRKQYGGTDNYNFVRHTPGRHTGYHLMCMYTGTRYLSKYYPHPKWDQRLSSIRKSFHTFIEYPAWPSDALYWMSSHFQYVHDFFCMDGYDEFVKSGAARAYMRLLDVLNTGEYVDNSNQDLSPFLLNLCSYMLDDPRYAWTLQNLNFDFEKFRLGRSFWPRQTEHLTPPADIVGKVLVYPGPADYARRARYRKKTDTPSSPIDTKRFKFLSWRAGHSKTDDLIQIDGYYGRSRTPYHINALYKVRMFDGTCLLDGYHNFVDIWLNGTSDLKVPRQAELRRQFASDDLVFIQTEVADMTASAWRRNVLYLRDKGFVVLDKLIPEQAGNFTIRCSWQTAEYPKKTLSNPGTVVTGNGVVLQCGDPVMSEVEQDKAITYAQEVRIVQTTDAELAQGEPFIVSNFIYKDADPKNPALTYRKVADGMYLLYGKKPGLVASGTVRTGPIGFDAEQLFLEPGTLFLAEARSLNLNGRPVLAADKPLALHWDLAEGTLAIDATEPTQLTLNGANGRVPRTLTAGRHTFVGLRPDPALAQRIGTLLQALERKARGTRAVARRTAPPEQEPVYNWRPVWTTPTGAGEISHIGVSATDDIWVAAEDGDGSRLVRLAADGKQRAALKTESRILSLWPARGQTQSNAFKLLAGSLDDRVRAYGAGLSELWNFKTEVFPSYKVGDHYRAPWFSDPGGKHKNTGVYSIMVDDFWGTGQEEIVIGRPVTLEFHTLDGALVRRVEARRGETTQFARLTKRGKTKDQPVLLSCRFAGGVPGVNITDSRYRSREGHYSTRDTVDGASSMNTWGRHGISEMQVADLDNDGIEEVVVTYTGHWNELRVWSGEPITPYKDKLLWLKYYGPAGGGWANVKARKHRFMTALEVADLDRDGDKEIVVGLKTGWLRAYDHKGNELWFQKHNSSVRAIAALANGRFAVGFSNGLLKLLDHTGRTLKTAKLEAGVEILESTGDSLLAGTKKGQVARFVNHGLRAGRR